MANEVLCFCTKWRKAAVRSHQPRFHRRDRSKVRSPAKPPDRLETGSAGPRPLESTSF